MKPSDKRQFISSHRFHPSVKTAPVAVEGELESGAKVATPAALVPALVAANAVALPQGQLSNLAQMFADAALSPNTRRAYCVQWRLWLIHCKEHDIPAVPADPRDVANWLAQRAVGGRASGKRGLGMGCTNTKGQSLATLRTALAAVKAGHNDANVSFDAKHPELVKTLKGLARTRSEIQHQAAALRVADVLGILQNLGETPQELRDGAVIALGYLFARRRSELAALTLGAGRHVLQIEKHRLVLKMASSKTNAGHETEIYSAPRAENRVAVEAIEKWIAYGRIARGTPILRGIDKHGNVTERGLHQQSISGLVRNRVREQALREGHSEKEADAEASRYSSHSMRIGFVVSSKEAGADLHSIAAQTGHRQLETTNRYARQADNELTSAYLVPGVGVSPESQSAGKKMREQLKATHRKFRLRRVTI